MYNFWPFVLTVYHGSFFYHNLRICLFKLNIWGAQYNYTSQFLIGHKNTMVILFWNLEYFKIHCMYMNKVIIYQSTTVLPFDTMAPPQHFCMFLQSSDQSHLAWLWHKLGSVWQHIQQQNLALMPCSLDSLSFISWLRDIFRKLARQKTALLKVFVIHLHI